MAQQSSLQKITEKSSVQEESLLNLTSEPEPVPESDGEPVPESDGEPSSRDGTPDAKQMHFKRPVPASTPHDKAVLAGEVTNTPIPQRDAEYTFRSREEGLPGLSEEKFSVQESGEGSDQDLPAWLTAAPSIKSHTNSKDSDMYERSYKLEVMEDCRDVFKEFPKALGLIVLFACSVAAPLRNLSPVPGVVKGVDKMIEAFRYLGYAVLRLPVNLASWKYRAAMKAVASVPFPDSYQRIFVYYSGHGEDDSIDTPDGNLKLEDITNPFSPIEAPNHELLTKIFIFDTCSNLSDLRPILPHSVLVFPAQPGYPAFANKDDCGLLTEHLANILRKSPKSFGDLIIDVTKKIENDPRIPSESRPLLCQTLKTHVSLLTERKEAMKPSIKIREVWPTSISVVISSPPSSAQFHLQHLRLSYKGEGAEDWTNVEVNAVPGGAVPISNLSHGKHYTVKAVAVYPNDEEISSQEIPCDMPTCTEVEPVLRQDQNYCHVDSVEFEVCLPTKKDVYQMRWFEIACRCEETQEPKPLEWAEDDRVRISELEPGVRYTVKATAHYPNEQSVSVTKSFEIPIHDVKPEIESEKLTCNTITVSVTAPPQEDKYQPQNLSAELRRANAGKPSSWSQPDRTDQKGEFTFLNLSSSTTYEAKAIATYDDNKVVSSDPIKVTTSSVPYRKIFFCVMVFLILVFLVGFVIALSIFLICFQPVHVPAVTQLGLQGDTIVVSEFNSFGLASVNITECPEAGDDPHTLKAALVKKSDIIIYMGNYTGTINSSAAGRVSLLEDEYFLQGSSMAVNICLSSQYSPQESSRPVTVFAFVFDSSDDNQKFLLNETHSSVYSKVLHVGTTSKPICTWVNYSVASPAYYYFALGEYALGRLAYSADLYLHKTYLNFSDYEASEQYCSSISEMQPCPFELRESLKQEYMLVTYVCSRPQWFSTSTHVCAKFNNTLKVSIVVIAPATLCTVTVFLIIIALVVGVVLWKRVKKCVKKRAQHESSENVPLLRGLSHSVITADDDDSD